MVLGREKAFEAADFKGADVAGGFDLIVEYGTSLPLDPNLRRESIMLMTPMLKEAGMSAKQIIQYMKLNELEGIHDRLELASDRQREIFEEMVAKINKGVPPEDAYIAPEELEEHAGRLEYAYSYLESVEFKYLPEMSKELVRLHVKEREEIMAKAAAPAPAPDTSIVPAGLPDINNPLEDAGIL
jgi:hypothetical protein